MNRSFILLILLGLVSQVLFAQEDQAQRLLIQQFLEQQQAALDLKTSDLQDWRISSQHTSSISGVTHVYLQQQYQDIDLYNGVANVAIKDQKIVSFGNRMINDIAKKVTSTSPQLDPVAAITAAAKQLQLPAPQDLMFASSKSEQESVYLSPSLSLEPIPVRLKYLEMPSGALQLVWDLSIYERTAQHWWSVRIDANTGELLDQHDWVTRCKFDDQPFGRCWHRPMAPQQASPDAAPNTMAAPDQYTVFALPTESPSHGPRSVVTNPANLVASPFGWHDDDGVTGAEYTITRGNNVHAYEDTSNLNAPGYSPDGGSTLEFNFPYINGGNPVSYLDATITNLFYMNNMMHDIWYHYGFDEVSGNFQENNYGKASSVVAGDYVRAEAQDGSGVSNANFATPPDGNRPRMQMYIWPFNSNTGHFLTVQSPNNLAGTYLAAKANFGPLLPAVPVVADVVVMEDAVAPTADGCDSIVNAAALNGKIVMIDQGTCGFVDKAQRAQDAGALGVIIANNIGFLFVMNDNTPNTLTIPTVMVLPAVANDIKAEITNGNTVTAAIDNAGISDKDSDLDNGIIAHEYGHGISIRLTGGAATSGCLRNAEQMGEGWSDWFGLMLTMEPGDQGSDIRGIGTYVRAQPTTGPGIRPAPYSTDFAVNNYTYGASNNASQISQPHGVGFIFATVLWDLNWALIDQYGGTPDPDWINGTGGNNVAMNLVMEGIKLQPCSPGMIDGRDAILQADQLLYNGAHECLIWEVFAKRGFGYSASQGSSLSRSDQVEAFDLSPTCLIASAPPIADFSVANLNSCVSKIDFQDSSRSTPQQWLWDFGDGATSTDRNPTHAYLNDGTYTVQLIVTNNMGSDTISQQITITLPPPPVAQNAEACAGDTAILTATGSGEIQWRNVSDQVVGIGDTLFVPNLGSQQYYYAENTTGAPSTQVGPMDTLPGATALNESYFGALNFRADQAFELISTKVYAAGNQTITLFLARGTNTDGSAPQTVLDATTLFLPSGEQRVVLNFAVPDTGNYYIGTSNANLYQNNSGASYPYTVPGFLSINSSSSSTDPTGQYYYFYDLEVRETRCISVQDTAVAIPVVSFFTFADTNNTVTFTDGSVGATSWFWDFGDGNTSTLQNPVHTYATQGMYTISLTINGGSCTSTRIINEILSITPIQQEDLPRMYLMPNPASQQATLALDRVATDDLTVQLISLDGKVLQTNMLQRGLTEISFDVQDLAAGIYFIRVQGLHYTEIRKLVVE